MAKPLRKAEKRLERRLAAYTVSMNNSTENQRRMQHKPGSMQKKSK